MHAHAWISLEIDVFKKRSLVSYVVTGLLWSVNVSILNDKVYVWSHVDWRTPHGLLISILDIDIHGRVAVPGSGTITLNRNIMQQLWFPDKWCMISEFPLACNGLACMNYGSTLCIQTTVRCNHWCKYNTGGYIYMYMIINQVIKHLTIIISLLAILNTTCWATYIHFYISFDGNI